MPAESVHHHNNVSTTIDTQTSQKNYSKIHIINLKPCLKLWLDLITVKFRIGMLYRSHCMLSIKDLFAVNRALISSPPSLLKQLIGSKAFFAAIS